ncbi:MAG: hypothetical protein DRO99_03105 [Candidatus Aenigmatarchaeota archaeon]|nr:MAG: hypothetical protein DRO99_03105 [Candidatus Aenigmarchaeota archaeon]
MEHYDAPWHIASERVDLAVAGFDEIASTFSGKDNTTLIKRWPAFNSAGAYGEPIILGSAGLDDYCAHFIIAKEPELFENIMFREDLFRFYGVDPVLVDQKYVPIYRHFIRARGNGGKAPLPTFMKSDKVEADVEADGKMGIVIVNSGASVGSRDLFVYGMPVIQSETHLIADREVIERDKDARHVADKLVHNQYTDQSRMRSYAEWYSFLRTNITDDRWVKRPAVSSMFLDEFDRRTWSRGASRVRDEDLAALEEFEAQLYQGAR